MDKKISEEGGGMPKNEKLDELGSKLKGIGSFSDRNIAARSPGSISSKDMIFRADKIDLKSLDVQLEKHFSRVWSRNLENQNHVPQEEWEIDPSKLEIRYLVAQGTYGTVYRGTYDSKDVAGNNLLTFVGFYAVLVVA